jgi:hypothetical protein
MAYSTTQLQLTHVLQQLYRRLGAKVTLATGGSTTTAIVVEDAGGLAASPEGEFSRVTDYVAGTQTLTLSPALLTAVASGDRVLIAPPDFPLYDMIEAVNDALRYLSTVPRFDTSITTEANRTEYDLPVALKGRQILGVEIQGITTDANDNRWRPVSNWEIGYAAAGAAGTIILPQFPVDYIVRIAYLAEHARVATYAASIDEHLDRNLVHAAVFAHVLQWKNDRDALSGGADQSALALEQKAWSQLDRELVRNRVSIQPRRVQGFPHWSAGGSGDEFKPIPLP